MVTTKDSRRVLLAAVGDLMVGDSAVCVGYGFASRYPQGIGEVAGRIRPLFGNSRMVFGNLECALSRAGQKPGDWRSHQMRGWPSFAQDLMRAGFTHLNLANNHSYQHGEEPFRETVALLEAQGIRVCGLRGKDGWAAQPVVEAYGETSVGILGYSLRPRQFSAETPPYAEGPEEPVLADVVRLKRRVERVIVSLHWGEEYTTEPAEEEVAFGRALIDAGASVVLGHHPHVLRPIERYDEGVIAYSLGNFFSNMTWQKKFRRTGVLTCDLGDPAGSCSFSPALIESDYLPVGAGELGKVDLVEGTIGLPAEEYRRRTRKAEIQQQMASYIHALKNLNAYEKTILSQLVWNTVRNRIGGLLGRP